MAKTKTTINGIEMELQNTMDWSTYDQMWVEIGIDAEGNKYELYYEDVEGQELEDYDYDNPARIEQVESYKVNRHGFAVTEKKVYIVNHVIDAQANDRGMSDRVETLIETEDEDEARKLYEAQGKGYELIAEVREWLIGADDYDIIDEEVIDEK